MSTYQMAVHGAMSIFEAVNFARIRASFWKWWVGLYADAPRKLPPMI